MSGSSVLQRGWRALLGKNCSATLDQNSGGFTGIVVTAAGNPCQLKTHASHSLSVDQQRPHPIEKFTAQARCDGVHATFIDDSGNPIASWRKSDVIIERGSSPRKFFGTVRRLAPSNSSGITRTAVSIAVVFDSRFCGERKKEQGQLSYYFKLL